MCTCLNIGKIYVFLELSASTILSFDIFLISEDTV